MRNIQRLSDALDEAQGDGRPLKICVVTSEILGPVKNGGIGTASSGIVEHLVGDGHTVTVLFTSVEFGVPACEERDWSHWVTTWSGRNVELAHLAHDGDYRMWRRKSWLVKEFLDKRDFDVIVFNEHHGSGYYTLAAKRAGIPRFAARTHCMITHGSIEWVFDVNEQYISRPSDVEMMGLERRSVEWADVVVGPSEYLLRRYEAYGWTLPERTYIQPYPFRFEDVEPRSTPIDVSELVFFGRLETRKGLWLFCEALDQISERLRGHVVTFMGRITDTGGVPSAALLLERASRWPFQVRLLTQLNQSDAVNYLRQLGRLAVMPSLADNSPCVVYECMSNGIPFITTSGTGADELVHPDCWDDVMVEPSVKALSSRLCSVLDAGAALAWPRFDVAENLRAWSSLGSWLVSARQSVDAEAATDEASSLFGTTPALLVTLDCPKGSIGGVADHVALHMQRYGESMQHLILTSRMGQARELLEEAVGSSTSETCADIRILGSESLDSAFETIRLAEVVIFTDAEHEILPHFFVSAVTALMRRGAAAVSCVTAERRDTCGPLGIADLPCGDLPAAGGLGLPIGSRVWAVLSEEIRGLLTRDAIYCERTGDFAAAFDLGQALMHRLILSGRNVHLLPSVGAVRKRNAGGFSRRRHWYREAEDTARSLGIDPSVQRGAAAWLGINAARQARRPKPEVIVGLDLPPEHPLSRADELDHSQSGLSTLAAAMGRPDQAVRLSTSSSSDLLGAGALLDLAQSGEELRKRVDLLPVLIGQSSEPPEPPASRPATGHEHLRDKLLVATARTDGGARKNQTAQVPSAFDAPDPSPSAVKSADRSFSGASQGITRALSDVFQVLHAPGDRKVSLRGSRLTLSGRLTFIDIPLAGHQRIVSDLTFSEHQRARVSLNVVDQATGGEIAAAVSQVSEEGFVKLTVDLRGLFELASVSLVIETEDRSLRTPLGVDLNRFIID